MKYSIKDFLDGKIALDVNKKDRPEFNRLMDEAGMKWTCGCKASEHRRFPCRADGKALRWSRGTLPVVNFSDLLPANPTPADFFSGRVGCRCDTRAEYDALMRECEALMRECEAKGLWWNVASDRHFASGRTHIVEDGRLMYCSDIECSHGGKVPSYCDKTCVHRNNVPFSALFPAPAPKQPEPAPYDGKHKAGDCIIVGSGENLARHCLFKPGTKVMVSENGDAELRWCVALDGERVGETHAVCLNDTAPASSPSPRIEITVAGRVTTATLYEDGKAVRTGTAKCGPEDEFEFFTGATIAYNRVRFGQQFQPTKFAEFMALSKKIKALGAEIEKQVGKL